MCRMESNALGCVGKELFPKFPTSSMITLTEFDKYVIFLYIEELKNAIKRSWCKKRKAPGPNMIPNQVCVVVRRLQSRSWHWQVSSTWNFIEDSFGENEKKTGLALIQSWASQQASRLLTDIYIYSTRLECFWMNNLW